MKVKRIRRLAPCPAYDVEKIESWLTDMAKEGWILEKEGEIFGWLSFVQDAPRSVAYRLETKEPSKGFGDVPDQDFRELCGEYGWEYVDSYGNFFIYRSTRADFREMNTDLQVQAAAMKAGRRQSMITVFLDVFLLNYFFRQLLQMPCHSLVLLGMGYHMMYLLALVWVSVDSFLQWHHLRKLQRQLKANISLNHRKPWRKGAVFHIFSKFAYVLVIFLFFGALFGSCSRSMDLDRIATADYPGDPPFITAGDILPEGSFETQSFLQGYNSYRVESTFFAPTVMEWKEYGEITLPDGTTYSGVLNVTYYETRYTWLAEGLMDELYRYAGKQHHFVELDPPALAVEEVLCYNQIYPSILLRQGNVLVEANVGLRHEDHYLLEQWAQRMAQLLIRE